MSRPALPLRPALRPRQLQRPFAVPCTLSYDYKCLSTLRARETRYLPPAGIFQLQTVGRLAFYVGENPTMPF